MAAGGRGIGEKPTVVVTIVGVLDGVDVLGGGKPDVLYDRVDGTDGVDGVDGAAGVDKVDPLNVIEVLDEGCVTAAGQLVNTALMTTLF